MISRFTLSLACEIAWRSLTGHEDYVSHYGPFCKKLGIISVKKIALTGLGWPTKTENSLNPWLESNWGDAIAERQPPTSSYVSNGLAINDLTPANFTMIPSRPLYRGSRRYLSSL